MGHMTIKRDDLTSGVLGLVMITQLPNLKSLCSPSTKIRKATKMQKLRCFGG